MKTLLPIILTFISLLGVHTGWTQGTYTLVVEGFDWGPAVNKVVLSMGEPVNNADAEDYVVYATRSIDKSENPISPAAGERTVLSAYISDEKGNRMAEGQFVTLVLAVGPAIRIGSPFQYVRVENRGGNFWVNYKLSITDYDGSPVMVNGVPVTIMQWMALQSK